MRFLQLQIRSIDQATIIHFLVLFCVVFAPAFGGLKCSFAQSASHKVDAAAACDALSDIVIEAGEIGLPTSGAKVTGATLQIASGAGATGKPEFCKVKVQIAPLDPHAQPITVQLNLPTNWNGKAVHMGGGGLDGVLVTAEGPTPAANRSPTPLSQGYATFGSDSGHSVAKQFNPEEQVAAFMNDEVLENYASGDQLKKTHDVAMVLIRVRYGQAPRRTYFVGASYGGREALAVVQKWGADYDGAVALYPAAGGIPMVVDFGRLSRALAQLGAYPNPAKQALLHRAALAACDADDGAVDGIISNPSQCKFKVASIRCASGADEGNTCLSDPQIVALTVMSSDLHLDYPLGSGEAGFPAYDVFQDVNLVAPIAGLGSVAPKSPSSYPGQPIHNLFYDVVVRGMVLRDKEANALEFDPENPGPYASRMSALSKSSTRKSPTSPCSTPMGASSSSFMAPRIRFFLLVGAKTTSRESYARWALRRLMISCASMPFPVMDTLLESSLWIGTRLPHWIAGSRKAPRLLTRSLPMLSRRIMAARARCANTRLGPSTGDRAISTMRKTSAVLNDVATNSL